MFFLKNKFSGLYMYYKSKFQKINLDKQIFYIFLQLN